jgi:hypothetical protein
MKKKESSFIRGTITQHQIHDPKFGCKNKSLASLNCFVKLLCHVSHVGSCIIKTQGLCEVELKHYG